MHASDCAVNNGPALPIGPCDCGGVIPAAVTPEMPARTVALLARIAELEACRSALQLIMADPRGAGIDPEHRRQAYAALDASKSTT